MLKVDEYDIYFVHKTGESGTIVVEFEDGGETWTDYKGSTTCVIEKDREHVVSASSFCSVNDRFVKHVGRKLSLKRALEFFPDKEFRTRVWEEYIKNTSRL